MQNLVQLSLVGLSLQGSVPAWSYNGRSTPDQSKAAFLSHDIDAALSRWPAGSVCSGWSVDA